MKKLLCLVVCAALALCLGVSCLAEDAAEIAAIKERGVLKVGVKSDVPGFGEQDILTGEFAGLEIDLAHKLAGEILGDESLVEFTAVTASTRGPLLETGELDMVIATFTIKPDRILQYEFSKPYFIDAVGLLVKVDSGIESFADLDGKVVGVAVSATTRDVLDAAAGEAGISITMNDYPSYPELKIALDSDRIDCFSVDKAILAGYVDDTCHILPDSFAAQPYGVCVKKGNLGLLSLVDERIAAWRADGTLDALVEANGLPAVNWAEVDTYDVLWEEAAALEKAE